MITKLKRENVYMICTFFHVISVSCACDETYLGVEGLISAISPHLPTPVVT
jgi:hypothetical protein